MLSPRIVSGCGFQKAWLEASRSLANNKWEHHNLIVSCEDSQAYDADFHRTVMSFMRSHDFENPNEIANMIFPDILYRYGASANDVYDKYNRAGGYHETIKRLANNPNFWGTYFRRLTYYEINGTYVNQLQDIIRAINKDKGKYYKAAFTMLIQKPGSETIRRMGGPCLNYLAVQLTGKPRTLNLLAVYRNHDFLNKAYGNYMGLCRLIRFLAQETSSTPGALTCVSSHAYVPKGRQSFKRFLSELP